MAPLYIGDVLAGYMLFGHVFSYPSYEEGWTVIGRRCKELGIDTPTLKNAVFGAAPISEGYIRSAAQILHAVVSYPILERMAALREELMATRWDTYLTAHYTERLNAVKISEHLGIGKTQLHELSRQFYGCGTVEQVRFLRMEKAKSLLAEKNGMSVAEIAEKCGYHDYNYFITVFTREAGISPSLWRKNSI